MRMLKTVLVVLLLAGGSARADFIIDNTSLPSTKSNLNPLPGGADPTKYFQSSDYNALMNALLDTRTNVMNGEMFGLAPQGSTPNPTTPHSLYSLFVRNSDKHVVFNQNGILVDLLLAIGNAISGAGTNEVLYSDGSGHLTVSTNLAYDGNSLVVAAPSPSPDPFFVYSGGKLVASIGSFGGGGPFVAAFVFDDWNIGASHHSFTVPRIHLESSTVATALAPQQNSPELMFRAQAWDVDDATSTLTRVYMMLEPQSGNTVTTQWDFLHRVSGLDSQNGVLDMTLTGDSTVGPTLSLIGGGRYVGASIGPDTSNLHTLPASTGDIAVLDLAQDYSKPQGVTPSVLTDAATIVVDASLSNNFTLTIAGNRTLGAPSGLVSGRDYSFTITQGAGGSHALAYDVAYHWGAAGAPTLSTAAGAIDEIDCKYRSQLDCTFQGGF